MQKMPEQMGTHPGSLSEPCRFRISTWALDLIKRTEAKSSRAEQSQIFLVYSLITNKLLILLIFFFFLLSNLSHNSGSLSQITSDLMKVSQTAHSFGRWLHLCGRLNPGSNLNSATSPPLTHSLTLLGKCQTILLVNRKVWRMILTLGVEIYNDFQRKW